MLLPPRRVPAVTGEEKHLPLPGLLGQQLQGCGGSGIVEVCQGVVQHQRGLGGGEVAEGQTQGQIQLLLGTR